jgi:hypothetical protein
MPPKGFGKRMRFKRTNTDKAQEPVTVTELSDSGETAGHGDIKPVIDDVVCDINETETNLRLTDFRRNHKWDPNIPDEALEMVDAVIDAHDHKGEMLVNAEVMEDSPYPEVRS